MYMHTHHVNLHIAWKKDRLELSWLVLEWWFLLIKGSDTMKSFTDSCYSQFKELLCSSMSVVVQQGLVGQVISQVGMRDCCPVSQISSQLLGLHLLNRVERDGKKLFFDLNSSCEDSGYKSLICDPSCEFGALQMGAVTASHLLWKVVWLHCSVS